MNDIDARRREKARERKHDRKMARERRRGYEHELAKIELEHAHAMAKIEEDHNEAAAHRDADRDFALQIIAALTPVAQSLGAGILAMQRNAIEAQGKRLDAEIEIASKQPGYAAERVKLYAASGKLWME